MKVFSFNLVEVSGQVSQISIIPLSLAVVPRYLEKHRPLERYVPWKTLPLPLYAHTNLFPDPFCVRTMAQPKPPLS